MEPTPHTHDAHTDTPTQQPSTPRLPVTDLSSLIHDIESHLGRAQQLAAQHQHEMEALARREASMLQREQDTLARLDEQTRLVHERDESLAREREAFDTRTRELTDTCQSLRHEAEEARTQLEALRHDLEQRPTAEQLEQLRTDLDTALEHAAEFEAQVRTLEAERHDLCTQLDNRPTIEALQQTRQELEEARRHAAALETRIADSEQALAELRHELEQRPTHEILDECTRELAAARHYTADLESQVADLQQRNRDLNAELEFRPSEEALEQAQLEFAATREHASELQARLAAQEERIVTLQAELTQRPAPDALARAEQDLAEARHQLLTTVALHADFEARIASLQQDLQSRPTDDDFRTAREEAEAAREHAAQLEEQARHNADHIRALEARLNEQSDADAIDHQKLDELRRQLDEAQTALAAQPRNDIDAEALATLSEERDALARRVEELTAAAAQTPAPAPAPDVARLQKEIAKRDIAVATLHEKLKQLQAAAAQHPAPSGDAVTADPEADARAALRRERIARARRLLRERRDNVRAVAGQIEDKRRQLNEYETSLTGLQRRLEAQQQRVLAAANAATPDNDARPTRSGASKNAAAALLALVTTLAIVGGASWAIASRVATPTFAVQATLGMDGREDASPDALASWRDFHEQMLHDPQFLDDTAERMKRRGFLTLMNPTDLRHFLEQSADVTFAQEGEVSLTIRAQGEARAERLMETLTTSCIAWSNATRDLRLDNAPLAVVAPVHSDGAPVEDPRTAIFGAVFGGLTALVLFGFILMQRSFSRRLHRAEALEREARSTEQMWADATRNTRNTD